MFYRQENDHMRIIFRFFATKSDGLKVQDILNHMVPKNITISAFRSQPSPQLTVSSYLFIFIYSQVKLRNAIKIWNNAIQKSITRNNGLLKFIY